MNFEKKTRPSSGKEYLYVTLSLKCTVQIARDEQLWLLCLALASFSLQNKKKEFLVTRCGLHIWSSMSET